jgi:hypothetical protein
VYWQWVIAWDMQMAKRKASAEPIKDSDGKLVKVGDKITFTYGIPGRTVDAAEVIEENGKLVILTPGHFPERGLLSNLVGVYDFYVIDTHCPGCRQPFADGDLVELLPNPYRKDDKPPRRWHLQCHQKAYYKASGG